MKRWSWMVVLLLVPLQGQEYDPFLRKLLAFEKEYQAFKLEYLGCPTYPLTNLNGILQNCSGTGSINVKKFRDASKKAQALFDLIPKPQ